MCIRDRTMGSLGTIKMGTGFGGIHGSYDEEVPQAYEQASDVHAGGSSNSVGSFTDNGGLTWAVPSFSMGGATASLVLGWVPNADGAGNSNGGVGTRTGSWGDGVDAGLTIATDMGLTIGAYAATREQNTPNPSGSRATADEFNAVGYAKYSAGPVSFGYSSSYYDSGVTGSGGTANATKAVGTASGVFEMEQMSVAFNVNDNLSISYTESEDTYDAQSNVANGTETADVTQETEALQAAYSMGGMTIKAFQMEASNPGWDSDATKNTFREISIGLSF